MEFFHKATSFPFMATRRVWYVLSALLVVASIALFFLRGLNLTVDFTGGTTVEATYPAAADVEKVRGALEAAGFRDPTVQAFGTSHDISIRLAPEPKQTIEQVRARVEKALKGVDAGVKISPPEFVGSQVGSELRNSAILALGLTMLLVFVYIAFRFHTWRLSAGAILALLHDPILIIGWFALSQTPFDLAVVAALLAVVGYSLNDTIIVFDRIRERFEANRRLEPRLVLDQSINQTLSRTIMTKVTTLIVVVALLLWGGDALRGFSEALVIGILAGTYSSIYISSAAALDFGLKAEHVFPPARSREVDSLP
ncbi:MAG TPA: protein translocase subunit SecF [Steroidobacteraceae bacterium]|nr:protein translocase subunit SecF [Steroidobacteraceae bacterium]